jgi:hypothetical protein
MLRNLLKTAPPLDKLVNGVEALFTAEDSESPARVAPVAADETAQTSSSRSKAPMRSTTCVAAGAACAQP